jgi:hypothetical protein
MINRKRIRLSRSDWPFFRGIPKSTWRWGARSGEEHGCSSVTDWDGWGTMAQKK